MIHNINMGKMNLHHFQAMNLITIWKTLNKNSLPEYIPNNSNCI